MERPGELDLLMAGAWPAKIVVTRSGWVFRHTSGVTRRANSVLAVGEPPSPSEVIDDAESFYEDLGAEPTFLVSEASAPPALPALLAGRGYGASATTWMLWTTTREVISSLPDQDRWSINVSPTATDDWFDCYWEVESGRRASDSEATIVREVLLRPDEPAVFVSARDGGQVAAVGQVVLQDRWACVQCLATPLWARRQGAASAVLRHLAVRADGAGADNMFTAVMADNTASLRLFEGASFRRSHRYRYFTRS